MESTIYINYLFLIIGGAIIITVLIFITRWLFEIPKRGRQLKQQIDLLALIALKQGASWEEIDRIINHKKTME